MSGAIDDLYTWEDETQPYRAGVEDLGGELPDDSDLAPDPSNDPFAGLFNERGRHLAGLNRMIGSAMLWIEFSGGNPVVVNVKGMRGSFAADAFMASLDGGAGQVLITWASTLLPPLVAAPRVALNEGPGTAWGELVAGNATAVKVFTTDVAGAGANLKFNVELH